MAIKLGCRYIVASLQGITNRKHAQAPAAPQSKRHRDLWVDDGDHHRWIVTRPAFHLEDESEASVIRPDTLLYIFERQFGRDAVLPLIDKDTIVTITWSYTTVADFARFTTRCLVRKGMSFPIMLGQRDWVEPLRTLVKFADEDEKPMPPAYNIKKRNNKSNTNYNTLLRGDSSGEVNIPQLTDAIATTAIDRGGPRPVSSYVSLSDTAEGQKIGCTPYRKRGSKASRRQRKRQKQQDRALGLWDEHSTQRPETPHRQGQRNKAKDQIKVPLKAQLRSSCDKVWNRGLGKSLAPKAIKP